MKIMTYPFRLKALSFDTLKEQVHMKGLDQYQEIVVLGGKKYRKVVEQLFDSHVLRYPLSNCKGIGYMVQKLHLAVQNERELD